MHTTQHRRGVRAHAGTATPAPSAADLRQKEIMRISRRIVSLSRRRSRLLKQLETITGELRGQRRGLRKLIAEPLVEFEFDSAKGGE